MKMSWLYIIIHDVVCIIAGTWLVIADHPWWAIVPFLLAATTTVKEYR